MLFRPGSISTLLARISLAVAQALLVAGCCSINSIRTQSLPDGTVGQPYSFALEDNCSGKSSLDTAMWTVSGDLPPGLRFSMGGQFSGTPTAAASYSLTVSLINDTSGGYVPDTTLETKSLSLTIRPASAAALPVLTNRGFVAITSRRTSGCS